MKRTKIWVISDLHLGHDYVALLRGFKDANGEADWNAYKWLIKENWNDKVKEGDIVIDLGDTFEWRKCSNVDDPNVSCLTESEFTEWRRFYRDELNGTKIRLWGNHEWDMVKETPKWVDKITRSKVFLYENRTGQLIIGNKVLTHAPIVAPKGIKNIHGHQHKGAMTDISVYTQRRHKNVNVEYTNYSPTYLTSVWFDNDWLENWIKLEGKSPQKKKA